MLPSVAMSSGPSAKAKDAVGKSAQKYQLKARRETLTGRRDTSSLRRPTWTFS
jgi:hypothetical protein